MSLKLSQLRALEDATITIKGMAEGFELRPFQRIGVGGIVITPRMVLADEFGLGKTIQALAAVKKLIDLGRIQQAVIVSPKAVLYQWAEEAANRFPGFFRPIVVTGPKSKRLKCYNEFWRERDNPFQPTDLMFITFGTLRSDIEELAKLPFEFLGIDEASSIKNPESAQTIAARRLALPRKRVLAITATPIQARLEDYFSIMETVDPSLLGPRENFERDHCIVNRYKVRVPGKNYKIEIKEIVGYKDLNSFKDKVKDSILQRTIEDVGEQLPELILTDRWLNLTETQQEKYNEVVDGFLILNFNKDNHEEGGRQEIRQKAIQQVVRLQQICDATQILYDDTASSCKVNELNDLLNNELKGEQVVIFSKYTEMLDVVQREVIEKLNIPFGRIDGDKSAEEISRVKTSFQAGDLRVILMSTAGEMGLNLGAGKYLLCLDVLYNEGRMRQLYARIRRLDSKHPQAIIIRLFCRDTIEEKLVKLLEKRAALIDYVDDPDNLSDNDLTEIMNLINEKIRLLD